jgi:hypothetical protein
LNEINLLATVNKTPASATRGQGWRGLMAGTTDPPLERPVSFRVLHRNAFISATDLKTGRGAMFVQGAPTFVAPKAQNENLLSRHVCRRDLDITFQFRHLAGNQTDAFYQLHWA